MTITGSTISGNTAGSRGGGIENFVSTGDAPQLTIINSTLSGNTAGTTGGGIYNYAPLTLTHVTFSDNSASQGSSLYVVNNTVAATQIANTLIATSSAVGNCVDGLNLITDAGYNLSSDGTCNLTSGSSTNPNLGPLADNGGPTQTHALLAGSLAIDRIPIGINGCDSGATDQRGVARPQGLGCDSGAYEVAVVIDALSPTVSNVAATPNPAFANANVTLTATLDDQTTGNSDIASAEYRVGDGTWMPMSAVDGTYDTPLESVTATLTFAQLGTYTIYVRGTDASGNTSDGTAYTTVTVTAQNALHVGAINGTVTQGKKGYTLAATVQVLDGNNAPIPGVTVYTRITPMQHPDAVRGINARTNKSGVAKFSVTSKMDTAWRLCVYNLTKSGYQYDANANVETCEIFGLIHWSQVKLFLALSSPNLT